MSESPLSCGGAQKLEQREEEMVDRLYAWEPLGRRRQLVRSIGCTAISESQCMKERIDAYQKIRQIRKRSTDKATVTVVA